MHQDSILAEFDALRNGKDVDFFQSHWRRTVPQHVRPAVSLTLGNIIRQYGMVARNIDYTDVRMFPMARVRGMEVVYRMQSGLHTTLSIDWFLEGVLPGDSAGPSF